MKISEDLIKHITNELLKRLKNGSGTLGAVTKPDRLPLLHLVGPATDLSTPALVHLQENFEVREHLNWEDPLPPGASVLITKLNIQALVRVAEGDEGSTVEGRTLLTALLNGQPVAALKDGVVWRNYTQTAPEALLNRYRQCEKILMSYGLKLVSEMDIAEALLPKKLASKATGSSCSWSKTQAPNHISGHSKDLLQIENPGPNKRRVLTESDLMSTCPTQGGPGQSLHLGLGDIITPLAQDYVQTMQINIIRKTSSEKPGGTA